MRAVVDDVTSAVEGELGRLADDRRRRLGQLGVVDLAEWQQLVTFGLVHGVAGGMRYVDVAAGMLAAARGGLPGPVLEAALAVAAGSDAAVQTLARGGVVTSVPPGAAGPVIVGWGAVADLVVDQSSGATIAESSLEPVQTALPMGHGSYERRVSTTDCVRDQRWLFASALVTGLATGAVLLATDYVRDRNQFGRPLASFQAVQFRLAECILKLDAARLMVLDAARRADAGDERADVAAALAWIYVSELAPVVEKHTHQVMGAIGFTQEAGLIRLSYQSAWIRTSVDVDSAVELALDRRESNREVPHSVVLDGFLTA
jgi:hypothetical protein